MIADMAGVPLYIVHVSCEQAHEAIRRARQKGMRVFGEPLIQHLTLDESEYFNQDWDHAARRVMSPPFRNKLHQDSLWAGLQAGSLQVVATDHCAFTTEQKRFGVGDFTKIPNGTGGLEDRLPVLWTKGVNTGRLTMNEFVAVTSTNIAKILNIYPKKGAILVGADADIVVWDPKRKKTISAKKQQSVIDYNVFEGFEVTGLPRFVLSRGELVIEENEIKTEAGPRRVRRPRAEPAGQPRAVELERNHRAAQGRAQRHSGRGMKRGRTSVARADRLSLIAVAAQAAETLDMPALWQRRRLQICQERQMDSDDTLLLKADGFESYGTACEFVQVLPAKDGSKVVVGLCAFEGEDGSAPRLRDPEEPEGPRRDHHLQQQRRSFRRGQPLPVGACSAFRQAHVRRDPAAARRSPARWDRCGQ